VLAVTAASFLAVAHRRNLDAAADGPVPLRGSRFFRILQTGAGPIPGNSSRPQAAQPAAGGHRDTRPPGTR